MKRVCVHPGCVSQFVICISRPQTAGVFASQLCVCVYRLYSVVQLLYFCPCLCAGVYSCVQVCFVCVCVVLSSEPLKASLGCRQASMRLKCLNRGRTCFFLLSFSSSDLKTHTHTETQKKHTQGNTHTKLKLMSWLLDYMQWNLLTSCKIIFNLMQFISSTRLSISY